MQSQPNLGSFSSSFLTLLKSSLSSRNGILQPVCKLTGRPLYVVVLLPFLFSFFPPSQLVREV